MTRAGQYLLFAAVLLLMVSSYVHFLSANAADKNWLLVAARMWLSGKKLYVDIFEVNPPLIVWLYAIPVGLSGVLPFLRDYNILVLLGLGVIMLVIRLCVRLIALHPAFAEKEGRQMVFALLLAYTFIFWTAPMYFLDREHILLVLTFPYILRFAPTLARRELPLSTRVAVGLCAAVGFCIKPHAAIVFMALQVLYVLRERSPAILTSVENLIIYAAGALYIIIVVTVMPEYLRTVLPMAMATYDAYSRKLTGIYSIITFAVIMGLTFADFRTRYTSPLRREVYYFLGVCGGYLAYALANNGWAYTYNPLISMARVVAGWVLLEFLWLKSDAEARGMPVTPFIFGARACGLNLALSTGFYLIVFASYFYAFDCESSLDCRSGRLFFRQVRQYHAHSFGGMSLEFYKWSELSRETGERWDTRFNHLWMLPKFLLSGPDFARRNQWIIDYVGNAYAEDLNRWKPDIMFIDASPEFFSKHPYFDLVGFFSRVPAFREAWTHYGHAGSIDACLPPPDDKPESKGVRSDCRFDVYRRLPAP
jgi:hypothetical protein